jgi:transposase
MGNISMSKKELERLPILERVIRGELTQKKASEAMRISLRQVKRVCKRYKTEGVAGLIHLSRGKSSGRKIKEGILQEVLEMIVDEEFEGFGPTLLQEALKEERGIEVSREWLRQRMMQVGTWSGKKAKRVKIHPRRRRRSREGELIQIDGSYEYWLEERGPRCCLLVCIDDATSKIMAMRFAKHETTEDYLDLMRAYVQQYGKPLALYSDRHTIFKAPKGEVDGRCSQFGRAMKEIGIELIHARSPQAKGRVERANGTLQDRLIKKMRRHRISNMEEANRFLEEYREEHNQRFSRKAEDGEDAHVELPKSLDLSRIFVIQERRKISKSGSIQYGNLIYQIDLKGRERRMVGRTINVLKDSSGQIRIEYEGEQLRHSIYEEKPFEKTVVDHKELEVLEKKRPMTAIARHRRKIACNF